MMMLIQRQLRDLPFGSGEMVFNLAPDQTLLEGPIAKNRGRTFLLNV